MQNFSNINYPPNSQWFQNEFQQMRLLVDQLSQAKQMNTQRLSQLHQKVPTSQKHVCIKVLR
ncbi:hypothetical protein P4283_29325 [Bacillus thuringiensis]|nr:hypothetical protein [Bacillus thuringiensis]